MFLGAVKLWILLSTLASVAGWTLSALGMLNKTGYAIFAAIVAMLVFALRKSALLPSLPSVHSFKRLPRRFRRFLPGAFAFLAALVFLSGLLYAPSNHTGLSYRSARVLLWLQHGGWFWIHTPNYRMNDRACGIEWLTAPVLLFLKSDRALFLLNFIPFILMPGQIFSVWTRLGVRPRVARNWMWLFPTGYCFLLQAGSIGNDAFPTIYALAMMDFALRARAKFRQASIENGGSTPTSRVPADCRLWTVDLGLSILSAALLVGAKVSNAPLGLAWVIVIFPLLPKLLTAPSHAPGTTHRVSRFTFRAAAWLLVLLVSILISFLPTAILNFHYLHDWSGLSIEHPGMDMKNPFAGIIGNAVLLVTNNFVPTFFPMAHWWNEHSLSHFPAALVRLMDTNFEGGYNILGEMPVEDSAGLGFGISMLVAISVLAGLRPRSTEHGTRNTEHSTNPSRLSTINYQLILIASWLGLLVYCMKSGMVTPARLIAPYYPLLFPLLLIGAGQSQVVRRRWWQVLATGVLLLALAALIVTPPRPLWPANTILSKAVASHPHQPQLLRAQKVYEIYRQRADPLAMLRQAFPPDLKVIGFMGTKDDLGISMWKPYGSRRVEPFLFDDSPEYIRNLGIQYAVVSDLELQVDHLTIDEWLQKNRAEVLMTTNVALTVQQGPEPWYVVRLKP